MNDELWSALDPNNENKERKRVATQESKAKRNRILMGVAGALAFVVMIGAAVLINPFANEAVVDKTPKKNQAMTASKNAPDPEWYQEEKNYLPTKVKELEAELDGGITVRADKLPTSLDRAVEEVYGGSYAETEVSYMLPGEEQGYTADAEETLLKDGTLNPMFTFWTGEIFMDHSTVQLSRMLNPAYGGWGRYQFPAANAKANFDPSALDGVFSARYIEEIRKSKDKSIVPIYADWNNNDYGLGGQLLDADQAAFRWIGSVDGEPEIRMQYDTARYNYKVFATYPVKFVAWTKDKTKITRNGTLKVTWVANIEGGGNAGAFRVVVDGGSLVVK